MKAGQARLSAHDDQAAWTKVREMALHRLDQMERLEAKVLRGDKPDALHDFRVASRRVEHALDLLISPETPPGIRRLRRQLTRARKSISDVRNYDVMLSQAEKALAAKEPRRREAWQAVHDYLRERRPRKHTKAAKKLEKLKLRRTYMRLRVLLESQPLSSTKDSHARAANTPSTLGSGRFSERIATELRSAWKAFKDASRKSSGFSDASTVHAMRLASKRLRYLMEIVQQFGSPSSGQALLLLRDLQQHLGEWHDLEMEERLLAKMVGRPKFLRQQLRLAGDILRLMAQSRETKERMVARDPTLLDPATSKRLRACIHPLLKRPARKTQPNS